MRARGRPCACGEHSPAAASPRRSAPADARRDPVRIPCPGGRWAAPVPWRVGAGLHLETRRPALRRACSAPPRGWRGCRGSARCDAPGPSAGPKQHGSGRPARGGKAPTGGSRHPRGGARLLGRRRAVAAVSGARWVAGVHDATFGLGRGRRHGQRGPVQGTAGLLWRRIGPPAHIQPARAHDRPTP